MWNELETPVFLDKWDGFGVVKYARGFGVVFGDIDEYALTPQRYATFSDAADSITQEIK